MKAVWIDRGQGLDVTKARKYGCDTALFDGRDAAVNPPLLAGAKQAGFRVAVYQDPSWYSFSTGSFAVDFAQKASSDLTSAGYGSTTGPTSCSVVFDIEYPFRETFMPDLLAQWRRLRPTRATYWTMEANQGGWVEKVKSQVLAANIGLLPQAYDGQMNHYAEDDVRADLVSRGFADAGVSVCYDAAQFRPASRWTRGVLFTQGRLS